LQGVPHVLEPAEGTLVRHCVSRTSVVSFDFQTLSFCSIHVLRDFGPKKNFGSQIKQETQLFIPFDL
jgi:hypothetical protein